MLPRLNQSIKTWIRRTNLLIRVLACRFRYQRILSRIRKRPPSQKIRVLFLNSEPAKWKCQSVYEKMAKTDMFEPLIGITALGNVGLWTDDDLERSFLRSERFFDELGDKHVRVCSLRPRIYDDLRGLKPDIVFFPEPWDMHFPQTTEHISRFALSCYVQYSLIVSVETRKHCLMEMHRFLFLNFVQSNHLLACYKKELSWKPRAYRLAVTGHPALDFYLNSNGAAAEADGPIIYAPHWSCLESSNPDYIPMSTFLETGIPILEYAKKHPEQKWAFKPHPQLRQHLETAVGWTKDQVDSYYGMWESIGECCYDGNYQDLFLRSRAMVTDSVSFLVEYGASGKPVLHLVRAHCRRKYSKDIAKMIDAFYGIRSLEELETTFNLVLQNRKDPKRSERHAAVASAGLLGVDAAANIVNLLSKTLSRSS